ncbi:hypothetical protein D3C81_1827820 [compost metagenome]
MLHRHIQIALEKQRPLLPAAHAESGLQLLLGIVEAQQAGHEVAHPCPVMFGEALADEVFQVLATVAVRLLQRHVQRQSGIFADRG